MRELGINQRAQHGIRLATIGILIGTTVFAGCKRQRSSNGEVSRNWVPERQEKYMGVPAADIQAALAQRLAAKPVAPVTEDQWKHVRKLYSTFSQQLLWLGDKGVHEPRVAALLDRIAAADSDAIDLNTYPLAELSRALTSLGDKPTAQQIAEADAMLSAAFVTYGENMFTGQFSPQGLGQAWHINSQDEKVDSALSLSIREDDFTAALVRMRPQDPAYDSLRTEFGRYRAAVARGGWPVIPKGTALSRGDRGSSARMAALRARLRAEGYLADDSSASNVFNRRMAGAIADYQRHHAIGVDSALGPETVASLNVPADYRAAQVAANLERYRWMPRTLGTRYILVNVPQFYLHAYDSGQQTLDMKVIVGKEYEDKATPVFSDSMEYVVFRPYWLVTPTIAAKEIFPKGPEYLAENDMEVYNDHGREAVRQRPGPKNALGFVKFLFPNDYNIYLHDTPNHELFRKEVRAFSHGCIRVENATKLAEWVLGWDAARVDAAMHGQNNRQIELPSKIPVYIVYFTAYFEDAHVNFSNDLYDRDSKLVQRVHAAVVTPETVAAQQALRHLVTSD